MTDIVLEIVRAAILLAIFVFLLRNETARPAASRRGWNFLVGGFGLLLFGSLLDISENFESLNPLIVVGNTEVEAVLEKLVGYLGGFTAVAIGLMLWVPGLQRLESEISERWSAEAALRESEAALARAQRQARIGSWQWSVKRDALVSWSEEYARIHGVGSDEIGALMDRQMERVIHPDDRERVERAFKRFDEEGTNYEIEYRIVRPDGEVRHVLEIGEAMQHEAGRAVEQTGIVQDITERKQAEEALRESESLLRQAAHMAKLGHWVWDEIGNRFSYCSEELARLRGMTAEAYATDFDTHESLVARIHPEDRSGYVRETDAAFNEKRAYDLEYRQTAPNGELRFYRERGEPILDQGGTQIGTVGITQDITEPKRAEEALRRARDELERRVEERTVELRESEALFSKAFHASPALFTIIDPLDGAYRDVNEAWVATLGHSRGDALGKSPTELGIWVDPGSRAKFVKRLEKEGSVHGFETKLRTKSGDHLDVLISGESVEIGGERRTFLIAHDITERKQAEERLVQAQRMEAIGQLTGGAAHDFNNLLGVIMGNVELLAEDLGEDEPHVRSILQAALRGGEMTERLLSFSRQQPFRAQVIEIGALVDGMTDMLTSALSETIKLRIAMDPDLWTTRVDPGQLENALLNLALNARDAMPEGGRLTIEAGNETLTDAPVSDHPDAKLGDHAVLTVSDSGTGMPPDVLEHAFEPFFTTKEVGAGSGLGLSMVYGFAQQSGGYITIDSEPDHGSTVKLYLPRAEAVDLPREKAAVDETPLARGETVLLVEDDPDLRSLAASMLKSLGYRVMEAENGKAALTVLETGPDPDVLLSDVVLPGGMTGFEIAREATVRQDRLKVLLMSGYAENAERQSGAPERAHEVLSKPFRRHALAQKLRAVLDG